MREDLEYKENLITEWDKKQKRAFQNITTGFKLADKNNEKIRFLTLTTSEIQNENIDYDNQRLNENIRKLKQRIQRLTVSKLIKEGYLDSKQIRKYYQNLKLGKKFKYEYFRIRTNEGNGVAHILYKGEYIPYCWLVDNWLDLHNSWNVDIRLIKNTNQKKQSRYIVSQYLSTQETSFIRSSQSWGWIVRAYCKKWLSFLETMRQRYFYNPVKQRFYRKNKRYYSGQSGITEKPPMGFEVDIFKEWYTYIWNIVNYRDKAIQTNLNF